MHLSKPGYQNRCILLIKLILLLAAPLLISLFLQPGNPRDLHKQEDRKNRTEPAQHLPIGLILLLATGCH